MDNKITPGEIVVMAAGALALIASFLPFYEIDVTGFDKSWSSWSGDFPFLFPVATLIALAAIASAVLVALTKFANVQITGVLGVGFPQLLLALGFFSAILALAFLIQDKEGTGGFGIESGFGYWLLLIAALASIVGAVLVRNERGAAAGPGPAPGPGTV